LPLIRFDLPSVWKLLCLLTNSEDTSAMQLGIAKGKVDIMDI
jgi:hypothetical protein